LFSLKLFSVVSDTIIQMQLIEFNLYHPQNIPLKLLATINAEDSSTVGKSSVGLDNIRYLQVVFSKTGISFWDLLLNFFPVKKK